ncbi:hypothetical protein ACVW16_002783 [Bradyrhizobium sp. USDA 4474]
MAQHHGITDPDLVERLRQQSCLSCCTPYSEPRPPTIAKAWTVEAHHAVAASKKIDQPADREVLDHGSVAMKQHDAGSRGITPIDIVEYDAVALEKLADWWIPPFRQFGEADIANDEKCQEQDTDEQHGFSGGHCQALMIEGHENIGRAARSR